MNNLSQFSDSQLYSICKKWGREALAARRRFAGLLPEVYRREMGSRGGATGPVGRTQVEPGEEKIDQLNLSFSQNPPRKSWLEKRGYTCLYEFAARLAGMSRDQVNRVLQLDKRFSALTILHEALIHGDVSVNKLARIASVATLENQRELLNKAEKLSKVALEIYVKEYRATCGFLEKENVSMNMVHAEVRAVSHEQCAGMNLESVSQSVGQTAINCFEPDALNKSSLSVLTAEAGSSTTAGAGAVPGHSFGCADTKNHGLQLDTDVEKELMELQEKGIDVSDFLRKCLEQRKLEIVREMEKLGREQLQVRLEKHIIGKPASRYMQAKIKRIIRAYYGHVCSEEGCGKPAAHIHHEKRFALFGSHDPRHLRPLCKAHHELAHVGEGVYVGFRSGGK